MQPAHPRMPSRVRRDPFLDHCSGRFHAATRCALWRLAAVESKPSSPTTSFGDGALAARLPLHIHLIHRVMVLVGAPLVLSASSHLHRFVSNRNSIFRGLVT